MGVRGAPRKACPPGNNQKDTDHDGFPDVCVTNSTGESGVTHAALTSLNNQRGMVSNIDAAITLL